MNKLRKDLMVVFGFPKENAIKVETLWQNNRLPAEYKDIVQHLADYPWTRINSDELRSARYTLFNELNYKITCGEIK